MESRQKFKAVYFPDLRNESTNTKSFTLAFSDDEKEIYNSIRHLSSHEIRNVMGVTSFKELEIQARKNKLLPNRYCISILKKKLNTSSLFDKSILDPAHVTFKGGKELPLQNWYPYLEGYSPDFVKHIIENHLDDSHKVIYDPFAGSGTTPLVASDLGYTSYYSEVNPFLQFLIKIKSKARNTTNRTKIIYSIRSLIPDLKSEILKQINDQELKRAYHQTFGNSKFFSDQVFSNVLKTKTFINQLYFKDIFLSELLTVAVLSSLVENSYLKRQGDLRFRREKELEELKSTDYFKSIESRLKKMVDDLLLIGPSEVPSLITEDARTVGKLPFVGIDAVITSPPYLNGTNYFRNTKIELWFLGYLKSQKDLKNYRRLAVTAGINDVSLTSEKLLKNKKIKRIVKALEKDAYDKRIPKMVYDYFADMHTIFSNIKKQLNKNAILAIDLGDSIYSGIHVKTDKLLISVLEDIGYSFEKEIILRKRQSNNGQSLKQVLLIFKNISHIEKYVLSHTWHNDWENFKRNMPHHAGEMARRNWGDPLHSLCSYQGKLKPSIANQLVTIFVPPQGKLLDIFGGVGTIPLEAALQGKLSHMFDISPTAVSIARAKICSPSIRKIDQIIEDLENKIKKGVIDKKTLDISAQFGLNKTLKDYFHHITFQEIIIAREFFLKYGYETPENSLVIAALMHILHGNRPYALSRRSHGITPFAPTGEFEYKNLIEKLKEKVARTLKEIKRENFRVGEVYFQDSTKTWPNQIRDLDTIITSPPFFDSTRFYAANWMRLWFAGWDQEHFKTEPINFIDELQKKDFSIYDNIFMQARERLKPGGAFVLHLGKSTKCDMAKELAMRARRWFKVHDIFEESVENGESHGIKDRGSTTKHQYLVLV